MKYGTWIIDLICEKDSIEQWNVWAKEAQKPLLFYYNFEVSSDEIQEIFQKYKDEYNQALEEIDNIPFVRFFAHLSFVGHKIKEWRDYWVWVSSFNKRDWRDLGKAEEEANRIM